MGKIIELAMFRLTPDATKDSFQRAVERSNTFLTKCPGFIDREVSVSNDGQWVDILHWSDMDSAKEAAEKMMNAVECKDFIDLLDKTSIQMHHLELAHNTSAAS